jgi:hypothetical protein
MSGTGVPYGGDPGPWRIGRCDGSAGLIWPLRRASVVDATRDQGVAEVVGVTE